MSPHDRLEHFRAALELAAAGVEPQLCCDLVDAAAEWPERVMEIVVEWRGYMATAPYDVSGFESCVDRLRDIVKAWKSPTLGRLFER